MERPSGNSSFAIFPGRRPSAAPTASAPCWKDCRPWHARQERPVLLVQHPSALACFQEREQQIPDGIRILPPLTHTAFLSLVCASTFVVTDSPALQREALYAGKRALLLPPVPSGSAAVQNGWHIACTSAADLAAAGETVLQPCPHPGLPGTSGQASRRVAAAVMAILADIADGIPQGGQRLRSTG